MIIESVDLIIFIGLFIAVSAIFYLTIEGTLRIHYAFILATGCVGLIMLWGFIQSDRSTLPVWIQAGATTMLLIINRNIDIRNICYSRREPEACRNKSIRP